MLRKLRLLLATLALTAPFLGCGGGGGASSDVVLDGSYYTDKYGYDNADTFLGRGINMGNYLEATPDEGAWSGGRVIQQGDFARIAAAGFKTVRIPVRWSDHAAAGSPYTIDPDFLARVQEVVGWALDEGLLVVLNTHHYNEMMSDPASALGGHEQRLHGIWDQLCDAFDATDYPVDRVVFELLNEPNGTVGYSQWNDIVADLTTLIWTTKGQADRKIMIGTANWGGPTGLANLALPAAANPANTIITVHYYEPFHFTHQGADWVDGSSAWIGTPWRGTEADQAPLLELLDGVTTWNADPDRQFEIFMGEFGAYGAYAEPEYRKAWTAFIAREAEHREMSWAYWEFDQGFGAYDEAATAWRPELLDALVPAEDRPAP
jgi:endoglucanase